MKLTSIYLAVFAVLGINAGLAGNVMASDTKMKALAFAGTFLSTRMDIAGDRGPDGSPAGWYTVQVEKGKKRGKASTLQGIVEDVPMGATAECPGGLYIVDSVNGLGGGSGTRTFLNGKDQIYTSHTERELCSDETGGLSGVDGGLIVGGTGKYEGITGTWSLKHTGIIQYSDFAAQPVQYFGSITGTGHWNIIFPE